MRAPYVETVPRVTRPAAMRTYQAYLSLLATGFRARATAAGLP